MLISELAERSGVPVATIKFYLREKLLPPGEVESATRARYGPAHLDRLRLIRAMVDVGRMPLQAVRTVLASIEDPPASLHDLLGAAHPALTPVAGDDGLGAAAPPGSPDPTPHASAVLEAAGWEHVHRDAPTIRQLERAVQAVVDAGLPSGPDRLRLYWEAADRIAAAEVAAIPSDDPRDAVEYVVLGAVLYEPLLLALRRAAQEEHSARRFGG